jgi:hypothetical protein
MGWTVNYYLTETFLSSTGLIDINHLSVKKYITAFTIFLCLPGGIFGTKTTRVNI